MASLCVIKNDEEEKEGLKQNDSGEQELRCDKDDRELDSNLMFENQAEHMKAGRKYRS